MTQQASRAGGETMSAILAHPDPARPALVVPEDGQVLSGRWCTGG